MEPVEHSTSKLIWVLKFDRIVGPDAIFSTGTWTLTTIPQPSPVPADFLVDWRIFKTDQLGGKPKGKEIVKNPAQGVNLTATHTFTEPGTYMVEFAHRDRKSEPIVKHFTVKPFAIAGLSRHAFERNQANNIFTLGTYTLTADPQDNQVSWEMLFKSRNEQGQPIQIKVEEGSGKLVDKFDFKDPGCYILIFKTAELEIARKAILVYRLDLEVVIDTNIDPTQVSDPEPVPIYPDARKDAGTENARFELPIAISRGHTMRFRLSMTPPLETSEFPVPDRDARDAGIDETTGVRLDPGFRPTQAQFDDQCHPTETREMFIDIIPKGDKDIKTVKKGTVEVRLRDPHTQGTFVGGKIAVTVPEQKPVRLYVYYVQDTAGHTSPLFADAQADRKVKEMLDIANTYWSQCGVLFLANPAIPGRQVDDTHPLTVPGNAGDPVLEAGRATIVGAVSTPTNVSFVWDVDKSDTSANETGVTILQGKSPLRFHSFMDDPDDGLDALVLAHELWHGILQSAAHTANGTLGVDSIDSYDDGRISQNEQTKAKGVVTTLDVGELYK